MTIYDRPLPRSQADDAWADPDDEDGWLEQLYSDRLHHRPVVTEPGRHRAAGQSLSATMLRWLGVAGAGLFLIAATALDSRPAPGHTSSAEPATPALAPANPTIEPTTETRTPDTTATPDADMAVRPRVATPATSTVTPDPVPTVSTVKSPAESTVEPTAPAWSDISIEAESGGLTGSAVVSTDSNASGAQLVSGLGTAGGRSGTVRVTGPELAAGRYRITIYLISSESRTVIVAVAGTEVAVTATGTGPQSIDVTVPAGPLIIEFANPTGPAPAVDRIVLTRP